MLGRVNTSEMACLMLDAEKSWRMYTAEEPFAEAVGKETVVVSNDQLQKSIFL